MYCPCDLDNCASCMLILFSHTGNCYQLSTPPLSITPNFKHLPCNLFLLRMMNFNISTLKYATFTLSSAAKLHPKLLFNMAKSFPLNSRETYMRFQTVGFVWLDVTSLYPDVWGLTAGRMWFI